MRNGNSVRPKKWTNVIVLYDDGISSLIFGAYEQNKCLGIRWNGDQNNPKDVGYPKQGKYPLWFVLPKWIKRQVLLVIKMNSASNQKNIQNAASELGIIL